MNQYHKTNRIIIAPLCWGLGHATRCIPIINGLLSQDHTVAIASDGEALELLKKEFPSLEHFDLPSYDIKYKYHSMLLNMGIQGQKILNAIKDEKLAANRLAKEWKADLLISDNRLGFYSKNTKNIYITHQLIIPTGNIISSLIASKIHKYYINKYDVCWIPDDEDKNSLAGKMSHSNLKIPKKYIGPITRLQPEDIDIKYDFTAILSGPEPQRTILENKIIKAFNASPDKKCCIIRGTNSSQPSIKTKDHIEVHNLVQTQEINHIINASNHIICRSGYTSIMDLVALKKHATLIPTPGQYEQEYLAKRLDGKYGFKMLLQSQIEDKFFNLVITSSP